MPIPVLLVFFSAVPVKFSLHAKNHKQQILDLNSFIACTILIAVFYIILIGRIATTFHLHLAFNQNCICVWFMLMSIGHVVDEHSAAVEKPYAPSSTHWRDNGVKSFAKFLEHNLPTYCSDCSFHKPSPLMTDKHFCYPEHLFPSKVLKKWNQPILGRSSVLTLFSEWWSRFSSYQWIEE